MKIIALRQLAGDYGMVIEGQEFEAEQETANSLIARGLAVPAFAASYETKVIRPEAPQVSAREPFRNLPDSDAEPAALATLRDAVRAASDASPQGDPGGVERPKRGRSGR